MPTRNALVINIQSSHEYLRVVTNILEQSPKPQSLDQCLCVSGMFSLCVHVGCCASGGSGGSQLMGGLLGFLFSWRTLPYSLWMHNATWAAPTALMLSFCSLRNANSMESPGDKDAEDTEDWAHMWLFFSRYWTFSSANTQTLCPGGSCCATSLAKPTGPGLEAAHSQGWAGAVRGNDHRIMALFRLEKLSEIIESYHPPALPKPPPTISPNATSTRLLNPSKDRNPTSALDSPF